MYVGTADLRTLAFAILVGKIILPLVIDLEGAVNATLVHTKLVEVLQGIQTSSGLECPVITGTVKTLEALPEFNSKIWPVAIGMLAAELGITIADDVNIFRRERSCIALTIDETVAIVVALADSQIVTETQQANSQ